MSGAISKHSFSSPPTLSGSHKLPSTQSKFVFLLSWDLKGLMLVILTVFVAKADRQIDLTKVRMSLGVTRVGLWFQSFWFTSGSCFFIDPRHKVWGHFEEWQNPGGVQRHLMTKVAQLLSAIRSFLKKNTRSFTEVPSCSQVRMTNSNLFLTFKSISLPAMEQSPENPGEQL